MILCLYSFLIFYSGTKKSKKKQQQQKTQKINTIINDFTSISNFCFHYIFVVVYKSKNQECSLFLFSVFFLNGTPPPCTRSGKNSDKRGPLRYI